MQRGLLDAGAFAAAVWIVIIVSMNWRTGEFFDFTVFYASAHAVLEGSSPYTLPNLNPPTFVLLTSPLAWLPVRVSWAVWFAINATAFAIAMRLAVGARPHPDTRMVRFVVLAHASTAAQIVLGQVAWLLTLPITIAWHYSKAGRWHRAGISFGVALAIKPFLLPVLAFTLVSKEWRRLAIAALLTAATITAVGLPFLGTAAYESWWATGINAWHSTDQPTIASLSGTLYRNGFSAAASLLIATLPWLLVLWCWRRLSTDRQWLLGIAGSILTSPLGWVHYTAWLLPIALTAWPDLDPRWRRVGLAAGCVPWMAVVIWPSLQPAYPLSVLAFVAAGVTEAPRHIDDAKTLASTPGGSVRLNSPS